MLLNGKISISPFLTFFDSLGEHYHLDHITDNTIRGCLVKPFPAFQADIPCQGKNVQNIPLDLVSAACSQWILIGMLGCGVLTWKGVIGGDGKVVVVSRGALPCGG